MISTEIEKDESLLEAIKELIKIRPTYGYRRVTALLNHCSNQSKSESQTSISSDEIVWIIIAKARYLKTFANSYWSNSNLKKQYALVQ